MGNATLKLLSGGKELLWAPVFEWTLKNPGGVVELFKIVRALTLNQKTNSHATF